MKKFILIFFALFSLISCSKKLDSNLKIKRLESNGIANTYKCSIKIRQISQDETALDYKKYSIVKYEMYDEKAEYDKTDLILGGGEALFLNLEPGKYVLLCESDEENIYNPGFGFFEIKENQEVQLEVSLVPLDSSTENLYFINVKNLSDELFEIQSVSNYSENGDLILYWDSPYGNNFKNAPLWIQKLNKPQKKRIPKSPFKNDEGDEVKIETFDDGSWIETYYYDEEFYESFNYDSTGLLAKVEHSDGCLYLYEYDDFGNNLTINLNGRFIYKCEYEYWPDHKIKSMTEYMDAAY